MSLARPAPAWSRWPRWRDAIPFYGEIKTEPGGAWTELQSGRHIVVDPSLLTALSARLGDTVALGEGRFVITGTIESAPSEVGFRFAFGPRVYIPASYLKETGLLGFGARVQYESFLKLSSGLHRPAARRALPGTASAGTGPGSHRCR